MASNARINAPTIGDALLVVDVQRDFLPGGALGVPMGGGVVEPLNRCIRIFEQHGLPVFLTRDWHPDNHCSFTAQGGPWPPHCVASSRGAEFAPGLELPRRAVVISKGSMPGQEAYSGFAGTELEAMLRAAGVRRLLVGGLATDYCVLQTVLDGLRLGFQATVLADAIAPVDAQPGDGERAVERMRAAGALVTTTDRLGET